MTSKPASGNRGYGCVTGARRGKPDQPHGCRLFRVSAAENGLRGAGGGARRRPALSGAADLRCRVCTAEQPLLLPRGGAAPKAHCAVAALPSPETHRYPRTARCGAPALFRKGAVNKVSSSHIGCLVHGCFNASIPKPEHMPAEQWQGLEINVGDELEFEVFRLDSDAAGVFCIRGKLNITSLQAKCSAVSEEVTEAGPEEVFEKPLKKKKKKKKDPEPDEGAGGTTEPADFAGVPVTEETDPWVNSSVNGFWDGEPKKKKKKKKKDPEPGEGAGGTTEPADFAGVPETEETDPQVNSSVNGLWDGEPRKKKKKKKKKDPEPSEGAGGTTEPADSAGVPMTEETDPQVNSSVNGLWDGEPGKKKKEQHQEDQDQDPVFPASDSSGYQSDHKKKKKKRKHSEEAEFTPLLEHSPRKKRKQ
ncbi:DNA-directed RNA polymerase I subunit RPA43 isoform X2 [Phyllostomus discolor]|uniref:DNA-directed RNA polymerase subunit n=1 Tax=Phyllostomus discolor TaxID=89673 RepID=A0A7E6CHI9_9CHIR|nr:DNA-directed RNA polymerase I subunit RPA43 isoform X2 [Phyllostomus discolor]